MAGASERVYLPCDQTCVLSWGPLTLSCLDGCKQQGTLAQTRQGQARKQGLSPPRRRPHCEGGTHLPPTHTCSSLPCAATPMVILCRDVQSGLKGACRAARLELLPNTRAVAAVAPLLRRPPCPCPASFPCRLLAIRPQSLLRHSQGSPTTRPAARSLPSCTSSGQEAAPTLQPTLGCAVAAALPCRPSLHLSHWLFIMPTNQLLSDPPPDCSATHLRLSFRSAVVGAGVLALPRVIAWLGW